MSAELVLAAVLFVGGGAPCLVRVCHGGVWDRLVGLELLSVVVVLGMLLIAAGDHREAYLIVPMVLTVLSVTGSLVAARLLRRLS
ncbi:MAG TPA: monovalent cation/H+ antiporter complex subunit F [Mycobacteriales bacterium]